MLQLILVKVNYERLTFVYLFIRTLLFKRNHGYILDPFIENVLDAVVNFWST